MIVVSVVSAYVRVCVRSSKCEDEFSFFFPRMLAFCQSYCRSGIKKKDSNQLKPKPNAKRPRCSGLCALTPPFIQKPGNCEFPFNNITNVDTAGNLSHMQCQFSKSWPSSSSSITHRASHSPPFLTLPLSHSVSSQTTPSQAALSTCAFAQTGSTTSTLPSE